MQAGHISAEEIEFSCDGGGVGSGGGREREQEHYREFMGSRGELYESKDGRARVKSCCIRGHRSAALYPLNALTYTTAKQEGMLLPNEFVRLTTRWCHLAVMETVEDRALFPKPRWQGRMNP